MSGLGVAAPSPVPRAPDQSGVAAPACANCGSFRVARYCADCGERQPSSADYSALGLLRDAFHEVTSLDGRLVRTVAALVSRPGHLTKEWFAGRKGKYVKPFSLFVLLNVVFFLVQPHTGLLRDRLVNYTRPGAPRSAVRLAMIDARTATLHLSRADFTARFDAALQDQKKSLLVVCIPIFALAVGAVYATRRHYLAEHLIFSLHFYAFFLVVFTLVTPVFGAVFWLLRPLHLSPRVLTSLGSQDTLISVLLLVLGGYLYLALRRVYGDRPLPALLRAMTLFLATQLLMYGYHELIFYTTLYSV